jgi:amino acid adenylation domain-containing protein
MSTYNALKASFNPKRFLGDLHRLGVTLWIEDGSLCYDGPEDALSHDVLTTLKLNKQHLMTLLANTSSPEVDLIPLSYQQQRIWFLDQLEGSSKAYHISGVYDVGGRLDPQYLDNSLSILISRHESLRTVFTVDKGVPYQRILNSAESPLIIENQKGFRVEEVEEWTQNIIESAFSLEKGPLIRLALLEVADTQRLVVVLHHLIADGWSTSILFRELAQIYEEVCEGLAPSRTPHRTQYRHFVQQQRQYLESKKCVRDREFWRDHLSGIPELHQLPTDYPRPPRQRSVGKRLVTRFDGSLCQQIDQVCRDSKVSRFMVLETCFALLLARYSGDRDIVVGTPLAQRLDRRNEETIGFFANTLVLRTRIDPSHTFEELLHVHRAELLAAYDHQELPFDSLVEDLAPQRSLSQNPLCQILFVLQSAGGEVEQPLVTGIPVTEVAFDDRTSIMDLTCTVRGVGNELEVTLCYKTDLFAESTMRQLLSHYRKLVTDLTADRSLKPLQIPLLSDEEYRLVVDTWNSTKRSYPLDRSLHSFILEQAAKTPERVALRSEVHEVTYQELASRSAQLARVLQDKGIRRGSMVGVCMERSCELVITLLAVLRAGAAYIPFDPEYPRERLQFMHEDSGIELLLLDTTGCSVFSCDHSKMFLVSDLTNTTEERVEFVSPDFQPEDVAYIIYTSGSTGKPKGAINSHRGIVNRLLWMQDEFGLTSEDTVLQKTPSSFDVSVWEFFWPLMTGATLVLAAPGGHRDPQYLIELIEKQNITTVHFVPSMLQIFLRAFEEAARLSGNHCCPSLRRVVCSGEALTVDVQERFFAVSNAELINLYGPTEAAVDVTCWRCQQGLHRHDVPLGRPIANIQTYVLDEYVHPVPPGVVAELYIGGVGVGQGYLNRPELTAERFLQDPFAVDPHARLYKTGDLVRADSTGLLSYLGRSDYQVKLRGFRIELGEIEHALTRLEEVREAVVVAHHGKRGDELVAYVVMTTGRQCHPAHLRSLLGLVLPEYMVPAIIYPLEALPLLGNGKVNRSALPSPSSLRERVEVVVIKPQTQHEQVLAEIWQEVLGVPTVGRDDNFFERGGHSLLASIMVANVSQRLQQEIPVRIIFEAPVLKDFASRLEGKITEQKERDLSVEEFVL